MKNYLYYVAITVCLASIADADDEIELLPPIDAASTDPQAVEIPIGEQVITENTGVPWYYAPLTWFSGPYWNNTLEIGINGSEGNAQSFSLLVGSKVKRETEGNVFNLNFSYGKTQAGGVETQNYALLNSHWDFKLSERLTGYNKNTIEFDEFKAFNVRLVLSGGLGYKLITNDRTVLNARLGSGLSHEIGGPDDSWVPEGNAGLDFEHKINKLQKVNAVFDYYPSWGQLSDYRAVTKVDWELLLSEDSNLSLKLGFIDRYDSTPNGARPNDLDYYLTFILKR